VPSVRADKCLLALILCVARFDVKRVGPMARNLKHLAVGIVRMECIVQGVFLTRPWGRLLCCIEGLYRPGYVVTVPLSVTS
jgi:hypothetical protein